MSSWQPAGVQGRKHIVADQDAAHVHRMEGVHVLVGVDGQQDLVGIDVLGQRQLHQDAVDLGSLLYFSRRASRASSVMSGDLIVLDGVKALAHGRSSAWR
jgi:hypothetical protein